MTEFLFSYGTLAPGLAPREIAWAMAKFHPYSEGWVHGVLYDLGDYPGAVLDDAADKKVFGSVFLIPSSLLKPLDRYEGFDPRSPSRSLFVRKRHPVALPDGRTLECWVHEHNGEPGGAPIVAAGRYQQRKPKAPR